MFSKATVIGGVILITTIMSTVFVQIREGFGDDTERSVLVQPEADASGGNRYAEPRSFSGTPPERETVAPVRKSTAPVTSGSTGSRYDDSSPRTASRSSMVDRLKNLNQSNNDSSRTGSATSSGSAAAPAPQGSPVPFRRPGGLQNRAPAAAPPRETVAPPVELKTDSTPTSRRPGPAAIEQRATARTSRTLTSQPRTNQTQASPRDDVLLRSQGPIVIVEAIGPKAILVGKPATYKIRAFNAGMHAAGEVVVRIQLPAAAQILGNEPSIGESQVVDNGDGTIRLEWRIDQLDAKGQEALEVAIAATDRTPIPLKLEWTTRPLQAVAQIEVQEPQLDVHVVGPRAVLYGQTEVYTVTVSNPGTGAAEDVVLDVALGGGPSESKRIGVIAPGGREVIKLELTAGDAGEMPILAAVRGDGGLKHEFEHRVVVRRAKLGIEVVGPDLKYAGSPAEYAVTIRNGGDAPAEAVEAVVQLPAGAKYLGGLAGAEQNMQKIGWRVGTLQPGDERTFKVRTDLTMAGENRFNAVAQAADQQQDSTVFVTRVEAIADLKLFVNDPPGPQAVGSEVEYEITVLNRGTKAAQNVNVIAHFAEGVDPTGAEGLAFELGEGQVIFKAIPRVAQGKRLP